MWQSGLIDRRGANMDWYLPLKLVHVLSAIVAVGTNVTYFVWLAVMKGRSQPERSFALETIKKMDSRLANPAYGILALTGVIMVLVSDGLGFTTLWILAAIGLYILVGVIGGALFAPSLRRQTELATTDGSGSVGYEAAARRTRTTGLLTMLPVAGILYVMVMKPTL
jgi:uncharacterized membrane protein